VFLVHELGSPCVELLMILEFAHACQGLCCWWRRPYAWLQPRRRRVPKETHAHEQERVSAMKASDSSLHGLLLDRFMAYRGLMHSVYASRNHEMRAQTRSSTRHSHEQHSAYP
jgi:hypothetical protein